MESPRHREVWCDLESSVHKEGCEVSVENRDQVKVGEPLAYE